MIQHLQQIDEDLHDIQLEIRFEAHALSDQLDTQEVLINKLKTDDIQIDSNFARIQASFDVVNDRINLFQKHDFGPMFEFVAAMERRAPGVSPRPSSTVWTR